MAIDTAGVGYRRAKDSDARAVTALLKGIYAEWRFFVGDSPASERNLALRISHDDPARSHYCVATHYEDVVGWSELHRPPAWRLEHVAVLTVAVAPAARGQGVGRGLLRSGYEWCRSVGVLKISLHVRAGNAGAARLYLDEGFELEGRERGQIRLGPERGEGDEPFEDNLIMGKWLS
ncbi:MAG TPA: GNAT family N-acetyltransferase [Trueperaceae bacterium]|nr:GNAT family N-acetyltransferase [Trueperaceae bacterium]